MLPARLRHLRNHIGRLVLAYLTVGCTGEKALPENGAHPRAMPVGLFGTWVDRRQRPVPDTLVLREDSTASGVNRRVDDVPMRVTRWKVAFLSKDPITSRADVLGGIYQDGGDLSCTMAPDSTCVSAPVLCLGDTTSYDCLGFKYRGDSLALSNGARYERSRMENHASR